MKRAARIMAIVYAVGAIVTFGHSASNRHTCHGWEDKPRSCDQGDDAGFGFGASLFWPLYWSWELADIARRGAA